MKKTVSLLLCAVLMLTLLAACQNTPEVPYVSNPGMQNNQNNTTPPTQSTQGGQQTTTPPTQPNQGGQQTTTPPTQPNQGGQQSTTPPTQPNQGGQQSTTPPTQPNQGGQQTARPDKEVPQTTPPTQPTQPTQTEPTQSEDFVLPTPEECTYEQYMNMTGDQQEQFFNQFKGDFAAFFAWLEKAKAESDANSNDIVVGPDTTIDMDSILGKQ